MDNPADDKKEMSMERESSTDAAPEKQSISTKSRGTELIRLLSRNHISLNFTFPSSIMLSSISVWQFVLVDILLNATGNVPIMKKRKWAVEGNKPISSIMSFIHKYLKMDAEDKLVSFPKYRLVASIGSACNC